MASDAKPNRPVRLLARFNRLVTNRIQGLWAPYLPPYAMVLHRGRRSGKAYRAPVVASFRHDRVSIALPYGEDSDWVRNLIAAGGGEVIRRGRTYAVTNPRVVASDDPDLLPDGPRWLRRLARIALVTDLA